MNRKAKLHDFDGAVCATVELTSVAPDVLLLGPERAFVFATPQESVRFVTYREVRPLRVVEEKAKQLRTEENEGLTRDLARMRARTRERRAKAKGREEPRVSLEEFRSAGGMK